MVRRRLAGAVACVGFLMMAMPLAGAGQALPVTLRDFCSDELHTGAPYADPNGGPPLTGVLSVVPFAGSLDGLPKGATDVGFRFDAGGPSGEVLSYEGPVDDQSRFQGLLGINQGGTYQPMNFEVTGEGPDGTFSVSIPPSDLPAMEVTFDASAPCDATTVEPGTPAEASAPSTESTTTTTASTTTAVTSPPTTTFHVDLGDKPAESTFHRSFLIPIVLGGILIVIGVTIYYKTRERPRPGDDGGVSRHGGPPGEGEGEGEDPRDVPVPVPMADQCDWAAYYDDGTQRIQLRQAVGDECCVYVVRMTSQIRDAEVAAKGDQSRTPGAAQSPDDRLRLFDFDVDFTGLDLVTWASARTGPAGRLDWMEAGPAANWPRSSEVHEPNGAYRAQTGVFEEDPDAAIRVWYDEVNKLAITLASGCPDHQSSYTAQGSSSGSLQVNGECTNREPGPECPVELDAQTSTTSRVSGDLTYVVDAVAPGSGDEVEGLGGLDVREVDGQVLHGSHVDSHDHLGRARQTYDGALSSGGGPAVTTSDDFALQVDNVALHDVEVLVPARVWATTDAVTADVYVEVSHDITVDAAMTRTTCAPAGSGCCGHARCLCDPKLTVTFKDGTARIDCDGQTFHLDRSRFGLAVAMGAEVPWGLT